VRNRERGFTLLEVLIAMGIATLLLGSMYSVFTSSQRTFRVQEQIAEAQQNARAAIQLMSRDIIMAGYSSASGIIDANKTSLTIQSRGTNISYSLYSSNRIGRTTGGTRQEVVERVRRLSFQYKHCGEGGQISLDGSGNVPSSSIPDIYQILISVTVGTPVFNGYSGSYTLETILTPRKLRYSDPC
jgi:prepilin-type N-terminal cleavage/methylation domain-containing protein